MSGSKISFTSENITVPGNFLNHALHYAEAGLPVIPLHSITHEGGCTCGKKDCGSPGKHPKTKNGLKDATTDVEQIKKWWPKESALPSNIGVVTGGESGLVVIDIDGNEVFEALGVERVEDLKAGSVPCVKTGRGYHYYFKSEMPIKTKPSFVNKVDIKSDGGYVVAPPSIHANGNRYEWIKMPDGGLPVIPVWVLNGHDTHSKKKLVSNTANTVIPEGQRNDVLFKLACSLRAKDVSYETALTTLECENQQRCTPPLDKSEVEHLVNSAYGRYPAGGVVGVVEELDEPGDMIPALNFPMDVFPDRFKSLISEVSTAIGVSPEVAASTTLGMLSSCIGNTVRVSPKKDYTVPPFLWVAIVMESGSAKSPLINMLSNPIKQRQAEAYRRFKQELSLYEEELCKHRKSKDDTGERLETPRLEQYYMGESTVESLIPAFESQPRGILSLQDELSGMINGIDQYKAKGNGRQQYLSIFNCEPLKNDRKGGSVFVPNVGMSIVGGIQPGVLPRIFNDNSFHEGLIQRFIFTCPDVRPSSFSFESVSDKDLAYWEDLTCWCFDMPIKLDELGFVKPEILTLSNEALSLWVKFYNEYGQWATILPSRVRGFIPKLHLYSLKFAGLLHVINSFDKKHIATEINKETTQGAIKLTEYYFGQVGKILRLYDKKKGEVNDQHKRIVDIIYKLRGEVFNDKLKLSRIAETYNEGLSGYAHITNKKLADILREEFKLTVERSTGGLRYLFWEDQKIENLLKTTLTSLTQDKVTQVTQVTQVSENFESKNKIPVEVVGKLDTDNLFREVFI